MNRSPTPIGMLLFASTREAVPIAPSKLAKREKPPSDRFVYVAPAG